MNAQETFEKFLKLVGKEVEVGQSSTGKKLIGKITNAMFDSFILEDSKDKHIIRFNDLIFVNEL